MSLYQCEECGCRENTALAGYWSRNDTNSGCQGRALCSACDPDIGRWHGQFERLFLPRGMFITNNRGNLSHIDTGDDDVRMYAITQEHSLIEQLKPCLAVPKCFEELLRHAHGMTMGTDWNKGTMASHHRELLGEAVVQCQAWLAAYRASEKNHG